MTDDPDRDVIVRRHGIRLLAINAEQSSPVSAVWRAHVLPVCSRRRGRTPSRSTGRCATRATASAVSGRSGSSCSVLPAHAERYRASSGPRYGGHASHSGDAADKPAPQTHVTAPPDRFHLDQRGVTPSDAVLCAAQRPRWRPWVLSLGAVVRCLKGCRGVPVLAAGECAEARGVVGRQGDGRRGAVGSKRELGA